MGVASWSHGICALAHGVLAVALFFGGQRTRARQVLGLTVALIALWAAAVVIDARLTFNADLDEWLEMARTLGIIAFTIYLIRRSFPAQGLGIALEIALLALLLAWSAALLTGGVVLGAQAVDLVRLSGAVFGLICLENLVRNTNPERRWSIKFGATGLGLILAYDLVLHLVAALYGRVDADLWAARGLVDAFAVPLLLVSAARNPNWSINLHVSRQVVFHSATAFVAGLVILVVALGGYYIRATGNTLGSFLQIISVALAAIGSALIATSGTLRSRLRNFIAQNFFSYRYDYRQEWLRFISTIAAGDELANLRVRAIEAIADIVDSPAGAVWLVDDRSDQLAPAGVWNIQRVLGGMALSAADLGELLGKGEPIPAADFIAGLTSPASELRETLREFWIIVPLAHRSVSGFVALMPPRAPRELGWEDFDLLKTVGQQVASYLAEDAALRELVEARQLEDFNRRFAFVVHDLKNMTSQLQLLVRNADRHGDNPEFQKDLLATVRNAVDKMTKLLEQLSSKRLSESIAVGASAGLNLDDLLSELCSRWPAGVISLNAGGEGLTVRGDREKLSAALSHVIQNAVEATEGHGPVSLRLLRRGEIAAIEVEDRGKGMDETFVREELFRPFSSTKSAGYGIGAYQARELVRELGGSLTVASRLGQGTVVTISMPVVRP